VRVTFVSAIFPPEPEPGSVMAGELAREWAKAGHQVTVIAPLPNRPHGTRYAAFPARPWTVHTFEGARCVRVWSWLIGEDRRHAARVLENITFGAASAIAILLSRRPDVVVLQSWPVLAAAAAMAVCVARGIKVIHYVQDIYPEAAIAAGILKPGPLARVLRAIDGWVCRRAASNVVVSQGAAAWLAQSRDIPDAKLRVIFNWLDLRAIGPTDGGASWRHAHGFTPDERIFMFAGTMGYASRVDLLVDVAEKLRAQDRIRLVCVGHGPLKARMEEEIRRRALTNITLLPFQPRERVPDMQSAADVMLLTTSAQIGASSVPSKVITYLAVGKPVICSMPAETDIAALVRNEKLGVVVAPEDADLLADAITHLSTIPRSTLAAAGQRARSVAVRHYSLDSALLNFGELLAALAPAGA
jgi:colanic acid biosynthesis glycosyl transferase WcaI